MIIVRGDGFNLCVDDSEGVYFAEFHPHDRLDAKALESELKYHGLELLTEDEHPSELLADNVVMVWAAKRE